jgi:hypothetical protein
VRRLLLVAFFLEIGFVLIVVPWSAFWDRNYFAGAMPAVYELITNNYVRGAVSGLGLVNVCAGLTELVSMLVTRDVTHQPTSVFQPHATED